MFNKVKSPKIELPEDSKIVGRLKRKLKEYNKRYITLEKKMAREHPYWSPERINLTKNIFLKIY